MQGHMHPVQGCPLQCREGKIVFCMGQHPVIAACTKSLQQGSCNLRDMHCADSA